MLSPKLKCHMTDIVDSFTRLLNTCFNYSWWWRWWWWCPKSWETNDNFRPKYCTTKDTSSCCIIFARMNFRSVCFVSPMLSLYLLGERTFGKKKKKKLNKRLIFFLSSSNSFLTNEFRLNRELSFEKKNSLWHKMHKQRHFTGEVSKWQQKDIERKEEEERDLASLAFDWKKPVVHQV